MNVNDCLKLCPELHISNVRLEKGQWGSNLRHLDRLILEAARPGESEGEAAVVRGASGGLVLDCGRSWAWPWPSSSQLTQGSPCSKLAISHCKSLLKTVYKDAEHGNSRACMSRVRSCARVRDTAVTACPGHPYCVS